MLVGVCLVSLVGLATLASLMRLLRFGSCINLVCLFFWGGAVLASPVNLVS